MSDAFEPSPGLPDPDRQPGFYSGIVAKRFFAWLIDLAFVFAITGAISLVTIVGLFVIPLIWAVVDFCYRTITLNNRSATWGHRIMGIEFRDSTGRRFDLATAGLHTLGYMLSMSFLLPQIVSIILMMTGSRGQSLTDVVLGSAAINRPAEAL